MILKNKTQNNFTMISNNILRDNSLKMIDRGVMCTICSLPDGWDFSVAGLCKIVPDGKDAIRKSLKRLETKGYLRRFSVHGNHGRFKTHIEVFTEKERVGKALQSIDHGGFTVAEKPLRKNRHGETVAVNPPQYNTDYIKRSSNKDNDKSIIHSKPEDDDFEMITAESEDRMNEGMKDNTKLDLFIKSTKKRVEYERLIQSVKVDEIVYVDLLVRIIAEELCDADSKCIKVAGVYMDGPSAVSHLLNYKFDEIFAVAKNLRAANIPTDKPKSYYFTSLDNQLKLNKPEVYAKLDEDET